MHVQAVRGPMLPLPDRPETSMLNTSFALSDAALGVSNEPAEEGGESHGWTGGPGARPGPMPTSSRRSSVVSLASRRSSVVSLASRRSSIADLWFSAEAERLHSEFQTSMIEDSPSISRVSSGSKL